MRQVRRVVLILLSLVLVPSVATASWYRCAYDGMTRAVCCCPMKPNQHNQHKKTPAQDASVRAACCCTVTQVASRAPTAEANPPASINIAPTTLAVPTTIDPPRAPLRVVSIDRPRAQGDPPDTLFARRCSFLL